MKASGKGFLIVAGLGYDVLVAGILYGLFMVRQSAMDTFGTAESKQAWEDWRQHVAKQADGGSPVERTVPRSTEPPSLVLLRDHFATCVLTSLLMSSVLYWAIMFFLRGAMSGPRIVVDFNPPRNEAEQI